MHISIGEKDFHGVKWIKSKDWLMLTVATSAVSCKIPLFIVGKSKVPECFRLCERNKLPMQYDKQTNA
jgi:hypothetical protein